MDSSDSAPISAPGWNRTPRRHRRNRRRASIIVSTGWMLLALPVWVYVQRTDSLMDVLYGALGLLSIFIILIGWVALSSRFRNPIVRYPVFTFGDVERSDVYRYVGGHEALDGRVVIGEDYRACSECSTEFVDGVQETTESHTVLFGVPLFRRTRSTEYYCTSCRPTVWGESEIDIDTINIHEPAESSVEIPEELTDEVTE